MKTHVLPLIFALLTTPSVLATEPLTALQPTKESHLPASTVASSAKALPNIAVNRSLAVTQAFQSSAWFHTIDLTMRYDGNNNGFYSQLYVRFDAHTDYNSQPVYAVYSLIDSSGYETVIHTSSVFTLYGQSSQDWFAIETDLSQLRTGYYKLLIELVDARTGYLLAEVSGYDNDTLNRLPLEDQSRDDFIEVIVREESGGSLGVFSFLALSCVYLKRRKSSGAENSVCAE
ncbi:GlyGly-CTERM sorting domain-containing protein [Rheinheimera riviphila]|uniref:GlyGly-CTERM sorting domain-containing protein n=1 Tax=Rheinheimera riviphila TaxID=1834037 RepID=A0A437QG01_9GAMM|nr:choice-of-anchor H family protein [Rheinheimera riviphila]RVU33478.1 GlyGly-CTERM sorting domain-containing protein [Rheinheimera riviphila]